MLPGLWYLQEIQDLGPEAQEAWRERIVEAEGGAETSPIRVIASTTKDLRYLASQKRFSADLARELCQFEIWLPPLRERQDDLPKLVQAILERVEREDRAARDRNLRGCVAAPVCVRVVGELPRAGERPRIARCLRASAGDHRAASGARAHRLRPDRARRARARKEREGTASRAPRGVRWELHAHGRSVEGRSWHDPVSPAQARHPSARQLAQRQLTSDPDGCSSLRARE